MIVPEISGMSKLSLIFKGSNSANVATSAPISESRKPNNTFAIIKQTRKHAMLPSMVLLKILILPNVPPIKDAIVSPNAKKHSTTTAISLGNRKMLKKDASKK